MSGFSTAQLRKLTAKLDRAHVQTRSVDGKQLDYIEGWFALSEANAIFGFANWDRETVHFERLFERSRGEVTTCAYLARVRIRVRAGDRSTVREGSGCGTASARQAADAHELAIKAAETDATKRALATFGNRFGLCLYDKDQAGVSARPVATFEIVCPDGQIFAGGLSPEGFCGAIRKIVEGVANATELGLWYDKNMPQIERLRTLAPDLKTARGEHFAEVLERLFGARRASPEQKLVIRNATQLRPEVQSFPLAPSRIAGGPRIDKAELGVKIARRLRDKTHLRHVATLPCLVCQAVPSDPHHLTFAQPRGLALKVSDEFVVPLCVLHHNDLHRGGAEELWWKRIGVEPLAIAAGLWTTNPRRVNLSSNARGLSDADGAHLASDNPPPSPMSSIVQR